MVKLEVLKPGPLPTIGVTRYAVMNGQADTRADVLAIDARNDVLYRVRLDVRGDEFALYVPVQLIDAWSEPRLAHGGISSFGARRRGRLRWVQVTHQYDMLGRLCAYGALQYSIDNRELATMSKKDNGTDTALRAEPGRGIASGRWLKAVALHLEGKRKEALKELNSAIENGEETAESFPPPKGTSV